MAKKTLRKEIADTAKTGTVFFVIFEVIDLAYRAVQSLLHTLCVPLWKLSDRLKAKYGQSRPKTTEVSTEVQKDWGPELKKIIDDLPAGEQLEFWESTKELKEKFDKEDGLV